MVLEPVLEWGEYQGMTVGPHLEVVPPLEVGPQLEVGPSSEVGPPLEVAEESGIGKLMLL